MSGGCSCCGGLRFRFLLRDSSESSRDSNEKGMLVLCLVVASGHQKEDLLHLK